MIRFTMMAFLAMTLLQANAQFKKRTFKQIRIPDHIESPIKPWESVPTYQNPLKPAIPLPVRPASGNQLLSDLSAEPITRTGGDNFQLALALPMDIRGEEFVPRALIDHLKSALHLDSEHYELREIKRSSAMGYTHIKLQVFYRGYPFLDQEIAIHHNGAQWYLANGSYAHLERDLPVVQKRDHLLAECFTELDCRINSLQTADYLKPGLKAEELGWLRDQSGTFRLAYHFTIMPNVAERIEVYQDASTGEIFKKYSSLCKAHGKHDKCGHHAKPDEKPLGPEMANALDLFNVSRLINTWREGSTYYMLDGSRSMFDPGSSNMPDDPVGAILTIDAFNTSPQRSSFRYDHVKSFNNNWSNKTAVSAHYNAGRAYEYFRDVHSRNSINGRGGTIVSLINVADENGQAMDNAFWNGEAMFYGNGRQAFYNMARGLDVAGHEMSHGVIQNTANLAYQNESGAINESFADIFGAMIDREDWKMGEDVVRPQAFPSGALRDLSNPHNGAQAGQYGIWQPKHVNEQYRGSEDNGGVHINSGIPNHAYYLFVQELAKNRSEEAAKQIGEKVFYLALSSYLTRSSNFKDLRTAVEEAAKQLYQANGEVHNAVKTAFTRVGIGTGGGGGQQYQNDLPVNPGNEYIVLTTARGEGVYLAPVGGQATQISQTPIISKPSVTDDGSVIVFAAADNTLHALVYNSSTGRYDESIIQGQQFWDNVVIAKDGDAIACIMATAEPKIHVYDYNVQDWKSYDLYNPTYTQGISTGDVQYADFMDFDHSGEYVMYDALSELTQSNGSTYSYWDIGFLNVFDNATGSFTDGKIAKLFTDIPENSAIGNPVFSKNSPYIIAFDFIQSGFIGNEYEIVGYNVETSKAGTIYRNDDRPGVPDFSNKDNQVIFDAVGTNNTDLVAIVDVDNTKINGNASTAAGLFTGAKWGKWFADGTRRLTSVEDLNRQSFTVYPNPAHTGFRVMVSEEIEGPALLSVLDMQGRQIINERFARVEQINQKNFQINDINPGVMTVRLTSEDGVKTAKLLIE